MNGPTNLRRFGVGSTLDLILLTAVVAACLVLASAWLGLRLEAKRDLDTSTLRGNPPPPYPDTPREWFVAARVGLLAATLAIIPFGLRGPRTLRRAGPGLVTLIAIAVAAATSTLDPSVSAVAVDGPAFGLIDGRPRPWSGPLRLTPSQVDAASSDGRAAVAVLAAWSALALTGGWTRSNCRFDRLGLAVGGALADHAHRMACRRDPLRGGNGKDTPGPRGALRRRSAFLAHPVCILRALNPSNSPIDLNGRVAQRQGDPGCRGSSAGPSRQRRGIPGGTRAGAWARRHRD